MTSKTNSSVTTAAGRGRRWWPGLAEDTAGGLVSAGPAAQAPAEQEPVSVPAEQDPSGSGVVVPGGDDIAEAVPAEQPVAEPVLPGFEARHEGRRIRHRGHGAAPVTVGRPAESRGSRDPLVGLARVLTGGSWDGSLRTDATAARPGSVAYPCSRGRPPARWWFWPRLVRAGLSWAALTATVLLVWAWLVWPTLTGAAVTLAVAAGLGLAGWRHEARLWTLRHHYRYVVPAHDVLAPILGYPLRGRPGRYLDIPLDFADQGLVVWLPAGFTADAEACGNLLGAIRAVLPINDVKAVWHTTGRQHHLELRPQERPLPAKIEHSRELIGLLDSLPPDRKLLGVSRQGKPVTWKRATEIPHAGFNAPSGSGKSTLLGLLAAQALRDEEIVCFVDPKEFSVEYLVWMEDSHKRLHYWRDPEEIHAGLGWLVNEYQKRKTAARRAIKQRKPAPPFRPITLLLDESNVMAREQKRWWKGVREPSDPVTPPATDYILTLLQAGRQVRMHVLLVTQHGTAKGLGDGTGELREGLGGRFLGARTDAKGWKLFAPRIHPPPPAINLPGRLYVVDDDVAVEAQCPWFTSAELEALATTPRAGAAALSPVTDSAEDSPEQAIVPVTVTGDSTPTDAEIVPDAEPAEELVTLHDASEDKGDGTVPRKLATLKQDRARARRHEGDRWFPAAAGHSTGGAELYRRADLSAWWQGTHPNTLHTHHDLEEPDEAEVIDA